jgi:MFS family permease
VPEPLIGRFYGLFRLVGSAAGIIFNWFVFGRAHGHMRLVFACFAALYGMSFLLMCWKVREGNYPEVPEEHGRWFSPVKRYFSGCFGQARNWLLFLAIAAPSWVSAGVAFLLFFYRDTVGLSETEYGRLMATTYGIFLLCSLPFGWLVDRWGSQKALKLALLGCVITSALSMFLIYDRLTAYVGFISMNIVQFLQFFAMNKWTVDMYPRAQYGQFSSAAGILGSIGVVVLSPVIGRLVDAFGNCYRLCLVPFPICYSLSLICVIMLSRRRRYQTSGEDGSVPAVAAAKAP